MQVAEQLKRPSEWITDIMEGEAEPNEAPASIQNWLGFLCHRIACDLIGKEPEEQRQAVSRYPGAVVEVIRREYAKIVKARRNGP